LDVIELFVVIKLLVAIGIFVVIELLVKQITNQY